MQGFSRSQNRGESSELHRELSISCFSKPDSFVRAREDFQDKFKECRCVQVTMPGKKEYTSPEGIQVRSAIRFLGELV